MKVAYQGVPGAYSELAARALFGPEARLLPRETFDSVFEAVEKKRAGRGVVPVENSLAGSIHQNYDLLLTHPLRVTGEIYGRVQHALLAPAGMRLADIREVRSHPQALAQCSGFFAAHPDIRPVVWFDTAGAARSVAEEHPEGVAAIASEYAGRLYGLKTLRRNLQNRALNFTRFLSIARSGRDDKTLPSFGENGKGDFKTSLTFVPARNRAGVLHAITGVFAERGIDLTKIESRPDPENPFDYRFFLDIAGNAKAPPVRLALKALDPLTRDLRILGSYPRAKLPTIRR